MENKQKYNKFASRKFWFVVWACAVITGFGLTSLITGNDPAWMPGVMAVIGGIPVAYVTVGRMKEGKLGDVDTEAMK